MWSTYTGASLISEKLFRFYDIAYFSIFENGPHLDAAIISENILRRFSIDAFIFNLMDASLVLENFFSGTKIPPVI